jgi:hypothetical protein
MVKQFNTSGVGAHGKIEEVSPIFEVDKVKTAQEILAATDPDNEHVSSDKVLLPDPLGDNETALKTVKQSAQARVDKGVEIGGPTPAEREAEKSGDEGVLAAVEQERSNAASNSTGNRKAGQHEGNVTSADAGKDDTSVAGARAARGQEPTRGSGPDDSGSGDAEPGEKYDDWDYADLQKEVSSRNEDREDDDKITPESRSSENLAAALREDDEKNA